MPHRRIDIDALTLFERDRIVEFAVHLDPPLDDEDELLPLVADEFAELAGAARADAGDDGEHPFLPQIGAKIVIIVIVGCDAHRLFLRADAAAARDARRALLLALGEKIRHADVESLAELLELIVAQGQPVVLDLRQRRHGDT